MGPAEFNMGHTKLSGQKTKILHLPLTKKDVLSLHAGDFVLINGQLVTGRDKLHRYLSGKKPQDLRIPCSLRGTVLYHCGPIVERTPHGYRCVAGGPTTSMRVDRFASRIIADYGIRALMGKGGMGKETLNALRNYGCAYFHAMGGAAVYLADRIQRVSGVWMLKEFGMTEAMWIFEVNSFPAIVTMDTYGTSLHEGIEMKSREVFTKLLKDGALR